MVRFCEFCIVCCLDSLRLDLFKIVQKSLWICSFTNLFDHTTNIYCSLNTSRISGLLTQFSWVSSCIIMYGVEWLKWLPNELFAGTRAHFPKCFTKQKCAREY